MAFIKVNALYLTIIGLFGLNFYVVEPYSVYASNAMTFVAFCALVMGVIQFLLTISIDVAVDTLEAGQKFPVLLAINKPKYTAAEIIAMHNVTIKNKTVRTLVMVYLVIIISASIFLGWWLTAIVFSLLAGTSVLFGTKLNEFVVRIGKLKKVEE